MTALRLLLPFLLAASAGCSAPFLPQGFERLPVAGEPQLDEVSCLTHPGGTREIRLRFKLPDTDYDYGIASLVDPEIELTGGSAESHSRGSRIESGAETLTTSVQVSGQDEGLTSLSSGVEILLLGPRNTVEVPSWDQEVGKTVKLAGLPGELEVLEWSPEKARFRCRVPFPELVELRVSDETVMKNTIYSGRLVEEKVGEWTLRFDVPCPAGTNLTLTYPPAARRLKGRVEVGPQAFRDWDPARDQ